MTTSGPQPGTLPKVCLVNPPLDQRSEGTYERWAPHLGLGYMTAYLRKQGVPCEIVDGKFEGLTVASTARRILSTQADIVGITMMTEDFGQAAEVAKRVKQDSPGATIVVGGPHPTAEPAKTLEDDPHYDIAVAGEGEHTLHELALALSDGTKGDFAAIPGLAYRQSDKVVRTEVRPFLTTLDELPFPAWDAYPVTSRTRFPLITGRGCPYGCIFCARPYGNRARYRDVDSVLDEVSYLLDRFQCRHISFFDETFTLNRQRTERLLDGFMERGYHRRVQWDCETRVDRVDKEFLAKLKAAGCVGVGFGIESGNDEILKIVNKGITKDQARQSVRAAKEVGLFVQTYFILGYPFETRDTIRDTIRFARELDPNSAEFSLLTPLPGTQVYDWAREGTGGLRLLSKDYRDYSLQLSRAMELEGLPLRQLKRLQFWAYLSFYLRPSKLLTLLRLANVKRTPRILGHFLKQSFLPAKRTASL